MLFWMITQVQNFLSVDKVYSVAQDCQSVVAHEKAERTKETGTNIPTNASPHRTDLQPMMEVVKQQMADSRLKPVTKLVVEPQDRKLVKGELNRTQGDSSIKRPGTYDEFNKHWYVDAVLGEGGEGIVYRYKQRKGLGVHLALKCSVLGSTTPETQRVSTTPQDNLLQEVKNLRILGQHDHILELKHTIDDWYPFGPALIFQVCDLGDVLTYRELWLDQQAEKGKPERISEITLCKLFRDMILALKYIHHELDTSYVHGDFKPDNILVAAPRGYIGIELPEEPTFKLADFSRLTPWPTPKGQPIERFEGTYEYGPRFIERYGPVRPSVDIWALGATLQSMALGLNPVMSQEAFVQKCIRLGGPHPRLGHEEDWLDSRWRARIPSVFRPIDVSMETLHKEYDVPWKSPDFEPYSARLGYWYNQLWSRSVTTRPKASKLALLAIPDLDDQIKRIKLSRRTQQN